MSLKIKSRRGLTLLELLLVLVILTALGTMLIPSLSWMGERSQRLATQENLRRLREVIVNQYEVDMGSLPRPRSDLFSGGAPTRMNHPQLVYLFVNPDTHEDGDPSNDFNIEGTVLVGRRWQGPYLQHAGLEYYANDVDGSLATGTNFTVRYGVGNETTRVGDPAVTDAWGHPIVIQEPDADTDDDGIADVDLNGDSATNEADLEFARLHTRLVSAGRDGRLQTDPDLPMPNLAERADDEIVFLYRHDEFSDAMLDLEP
ncbi:MAG: prepilin-type N-terminal cleavage/methylation domain-containing protein [Planctomycetota bacterium]